MRYESKTVNDEEYCVCGDDCRSWYIAFFFVSVPVKGHRFALFFVDLLFYVGSDSRYTEEATLSVLFVVEWILIWALSLDAEKQLFRLLSSNVVLFVCACDSCILGKYEARQCNT